MDIISSLFLSLPIDLLESISVCVAQRSTKYHLSSKMTCRALKEISELPPVYVSVYLLDLDHNFWNNDGTFLKQCHGNGNPYAIYMKGCHDFFRFGEQEKGLAKMKLAADKGSDVALYTYAILPHVLWDDSTHLCLLGRDIIVNISSDFVNRPRMCQPHWPSILENQTSLEEDVHYIIKSCKCTSYDEWFYWYDKEAKGPKICEECFWIREVAIFFKFFGFTAFVNTVEW